MYKRQLLTTMFAHAGFFHLFVNILALYFIGSFLERLIGKKRFLGIYFASGIMASLFFVLFSLFTGQNIPAVGASGAIFGLAGVLTILTPKIPVFIMFIPIPLPLWLGMVILLFVVWIFSAAFNIPIGNTAHLGGFLTGLAYGIYLRMKYKRKIRILDRFFSK